MLRISSSRALALAAGLITLGSCSKAEHPISCNAASDCPAGVKCILGACVAGGPPNAVIAVRSGSALVTHRPLVFDGTGSSDSNPGGSVVAYSWSVKRGAGTHCDPSPARGSDATLQTIFMCEGEYQLALTVKNDLGIESAPAIIPLALAASTNAPSAAAGPDLTRAHRCAGAPLVCAPVTDDGTGKFQLAVDAADVESGRALDYAWRWEPPPGVDRASVSVRFEPSAQVSTPIVRIESPGTRIAGEWIFTADVTDGDGLVTPAQQKVTITNTAPTLTARANPVLASHVFNRAGQSYVAAGTFVGDVEDPDGDPVELPEVRLVEKTPTGCAFRVNQTTLTGGRIEAPFDLTALVGQEQAFIGPDRTLEVVARDVNGGEAKVDAVLQVLNSPPSFIWDPNVPGAASRLLDVPHSFTRSCAAPAGCFVAQGTSPLVAFDPDGDPLDRVGLSASGLTPSSTFTSGDGRTFVVQASSDAPDKFRGGDGTSGFTLVATAHDPFEGSRSDDAAAQFKLRIGNTPPHAASTSIDASPGYSDPARSYQVEADFLTFVDDDGDPIAMATATPDPWCKTFSVVGGVGHVACALAYDWTSGKPNVSSFYSAHQLGLSARDPWQEGASTSSTVTLRDYNAPRNPGGPLYVDSCKCTRTVACEPAAYKAYPIVSFSLPVSDPDGTPIYVTVSPPSCGTLTSSAAFGALNGANVQLDLSPCGYRTSLTVDASDGVLGTRATYDISVGCTRTGQTCSTGSSGSQICP